MGVEARRGGFKVMEVAAQDCDELCCVFERVVDDEGGVTPSVNMS